MRMITRVMLLCCLSLVATGCQSGTDYGETIDEFNGRLTHNGQPVTFGADEHVVLQLVFQERAELDFFWFIRLKRR